MLKICTLSHALESFCGITLHTQCSNGNKRSQANIQRKTRKQKSKMLREKGTVTRFIFTIMLAGYIEYSVLYFVRQNRTTLVNYSMLTRRSLTCVQNSKTKLVQRYTTNYGILLLFSSGRIYSSVSVPLSIPQFSLPITIPLNIFRYVRVCLRYFRAIKFMRIHNMKKVICL